MSSVDPPVFVLCLDRSGSTLVRYILDTHSQVCCPPEVNLVELCETLRRVFEHTTGTLTEAISKDERRSSLAQQVHDVVAGIMQRYASARGRRIWCDKSVVTLNHLELVRAVFPDARFICLYRHCLDLVDSVIEANRYEWTVMGYAGIMGERNFTQAAARVWIEQTEKELDFERDHEAICYRVKYEDLVEDPEPVIRGLFRFIGVPWEDGLVEKIFSSTHTVGPGDWKILYKKRIDRDSVGRGARIPLALFSEDIIARADAMLERLGYPSMSAWNARVQDSGAGSEPARADAVRDQFERHVMARLKARSAPLRGDPARIKFVVTETTGDDETWLLDLSRTDGLVRDPVEEADCTVTMPADILSSLVDGRMNAFVAYQDGKIKVAGDLHLALMLGEIF